jgi:hypothetical protein
VEHELRGTPNVYVRNMNVKPGQGAFTLASNLTYEYPPSETQRDSERYGAQAAGRTAMSANGSKVVFVTTASSNLAGPGTPPLEVGVHDMHTGRTELVSVADDPATGEPAIDPETGQPVPVPYESYGAAYTASGVPPEYKAPEPYSLPTGVGASISADGTTVAWMGQQISKQATLLSAERREPYYSEPLWRRIVGANGEPSEEAATRRVTGGSDPANPACAQNPDGTLPLPPVASDPCQGPFTLSGGYGIWHGGEASYTVQLSGDGEQVAFLATAPLVSQGADFGSGTAARSTDLYISDMREGISRDQALTQLSELAGANEEDVATDAPILDFAISPDGTQVAFTTKRTVFHLSSPAFVSAPAVVPGMAELFDVDLLEDTVARVTHGYLGEASESPHHEEPAQEDQYFLHHVDGALSPSFSSDGEVLAFSSTADNLVYGDGNTPAFNDPNVDGSDVFSIGRLTFNRIPTPQAISAAPQGPPLTPQWRLGATALSLGDGNVLLYVDVPAAGRLSAQARSAVPVSRAQSARLAHRAGRHLSRAPAVTSVVPRTLASAVASPSETGGGMTELLLKPEARYRSLTSRRDGLSASVTLTFNVLGKPTLHTTIDVAFRRIAVKKPAKRRTAKARTGRRPA